MRGEGLAVPGPRGPGNQLIEVGQLGAGQLDGRGGGILFDPGWAAGARERHHVVALALRGRVTIGATGVLGPFDLPAALADFHSRYPGVALVLRSGLIAGLLAALDPGEVDLVLGPIHPDLASRYSAHPLVDERLVLITPPGHRLAREPRLTLSQLRDERFVCLPAGSGLRTILNAAADDFEPVVQFETHSPASIRDLVSAGLGVALLAHSAATAPGPPVTVHTVHPAPAHPPIGLIHHRDRRLTPAARTCRQHLTGTATRAA